MVLPPARRTHPAEAVFVTALKVLVAVPLTGILLGALWLIGAVLRLP